MAEIRKGIVGLVLIVLLLVVGIYLAKEKFKPDIPVDKISNQSPKTKKVEEMPKKSLNIRKTIFLPYWAASEESYDLKDYDRVIYFGVSGNENGLNTKEQGYVNMAAALEKIRIWNQLDVWLALRLTDTDSNLVLLKNKKSWEQLINETIDLAVKNKLQGIVLDLEVSAVPSENIVKQISEFDSLLITKAKEQGMKTAFLIYGDTFYRKRPYDIKALGLSNDEIMVMAYDFHKSRGEPGPNFPFTGREVYGYDFQQMISDFLRIVPNDRLTIIFGLYGYDWQVDEKKRPINQAKAITLKEIEEKFPVASNEAGIGCAWEDCLLKKDPISAENEIDYVHSKVVNEFGYLDYHIIWFEDEQSAKIKADFLKSKGVYSVGYWAYGYY